MTADATGQATRKAPRDPRLDFFRGMGMYIILFAHITNNPWTLWIPARFGFSDATEIFVFCSGMASALAFGTIFARAGWLMGTLRIAHRMWQVYWAHLGVFFAALFCMLALNRTGLFETDYVRALNLQPFLDQTGANLLGLMTLTYVPNYFDILPMYIAILGMIPIAMALARLHPSLAIATSAILWLYASLGGLNFPAEYWFWNGSTREWFFDPFAWQLVFFTGFALMSGWLPAPPVHRLLVAIAIAYVVLTLPLAWHKTIGWSAPIRAWRKEWGFLFDKTHVGLLRYIHFLALAYVAWVAVGARGARLQGGVVWSGIVAVVSRVGQQSLAVFMTSMVLARLLGVVLDVTGRGPLAALAVNLLGCVIITAVAYFVSYLKRQPWRTHRKPAAQAEPLAQGPALAHGEVQP